jgi:DNA-directed RNA polymerase specialized sigma24 family protein
MPAEYEPTADQRALVESASAFGFPQAEIAARLKISEPTLRKHFRDELDGRIYRLTRARIMRARVRR